MMKKLLGIFLLFVSTSLLAAVYVTQTSSGSVEFSDTPSENAKAIDVPPVNSISSPQPAAAPTTNSTVPATNQTVAPIDAAAEPARTSASYKKFQITSPKEGENIQNQATIPVTMDIEPNMMPGDKVQLMLDGAPVGTPSSSIYQELGIVERGSHSLYGMIVDKNGTTIKQSNSVSFFVHRNSVITSPAGG